MSVGVIAELRHVKLDTVEAYLADAILSGKAYDWHRLHVSDDMLATVSEHASAQLAGRRSMNDTSNDSGTLSCPADESMMPQSQSKPGESNDESECLDISCAQRCGNDLDKENMACSCQEGASVGTGTSACDEPHLSCSRQEQWKRASKSAPAPASVATRSVLGLEFCADKASSMHSMPSARPQTSEHSSTPSLQPGMLPASTTAPSRLVSGHGSADSARPEDSCVGDVGSHKSSGSKRSSVDQSRLQELGVTIKMLKEQLPESIRYGQIRLCLAHVWRVCS